MHACIIANIVLIPNIKIVCEDYEVWGFGVVLESATVSGRQETPCFFL